MSKMLGRHVLVELYNCNESFLNDLWFIEKLMNQAAIACKATIVESCFHRFMPHGVSGVVVIAESHLAIHTWPEFQYASVDLFTCGDEIDPMLAFDVLKSGLESTTAEIQKISRGNLHVIQSKQAQEKTKELETVSIHSKSNVKLEKGGVAR
ncbi:MAG: adenosylmethionine decarboxylase [Cyanobacteria bacterium]|nr:adenosylmethionine decarboxylase [Cyanobacteriota bacterium]